MELRRLKLIEKHLLGNQEVCIVAAGRSPIQKFLGDLSSISAVDIAANTLTGTLKKYSISSDQIQELYIGNVF